MKRSGFEASNEVAHTFPTSALRYSARVVSDPSSRMGIASEQHVASETATHGSRSSGQIRRATSATDRPEGSRLPQRGRPREGNPGPISESTPRRQLGNILTLCVHQPAEISMQLYFPLESTNPSSDNLHAGQTATSSGQQTDEPWRWSGPHLHERQPGAEPKGCDVAPPRREWGPIGHPSLPAVSRRLQTSRTCLGSLTSADSSLPGS